MLDATNVLLLFQPFRGGDRGPDSMAALETPSLQYGGPGGRAMWRCRCDRMSMWRCRCDDVDVTVDDVGLPVVDVDVTVDDVDVTVDDVDGQLTIARCNGRRALIARTRRR